MTGPFVSLTLPERSLHDDPWEDLNLHATTFFAGRASGKTYHAVKVAVEAIEAGKKVLAVAPNYHILKYGFHPAFVQHCKTVNNKLLGESLLVGPQPSRWPNGGELWCLTATDIHFSLGYGRFAVVIIEEVGLFPFEQVYGLSQICDRLYLTGTF